ncbi:hypothetical protein LINGRAHAP2_LOCUS17594 [Linum grandiflorum]
MALLNFQTIMFLMMMVMMIFFIMVADSARNTGLFDSARLINSDPHCGILPCVQNCCGWDEFMRCSTKC